MTDEYIEQHFNTITGFAFTIEARLDDTDCTIENLKDDNHRCIEGFQKVSEPVVFITYKYEQVIESILAD